MGIRSGDGDNNPHTEDINVHPLEKPSTDFQQLRMLNWNIEGLCSKLSNGDFMEYICGFDVVCLTETFLDFKSPLDCFPDFRQFISPSIKISRQGRSCGGVIIMVKRRLETILRC